MVSHAPDASAGLADEQLVQRVRAGERAAFEILMRRHNRRLYRLARAVLRDATEAEDVLQEAYLQAFRTLDGFRGDAPLSTWLYRLVLNECLARRRRDTRRHNVVRMVSYDSHPAAREIEDTLERPDRSADRAQVRDVLERKVNDLPDAFRVVFVLRSVEELSVEEVALLLGIPEETVRSRHHRARSLLRESLAQDVDIAERDLFDFAGSRCDRIVSAVLAVVGAGQ
ncbi:MAG TPA: RNA polymerase sigma factor [Steroidobacteraceae bacterium]|nr:RNA polymerase sigma factor [Steroidobacteraceae bacterium]